MTSGGTTPTLSLTLYDATATDKAETFSSYRAVQSGTALTSNMYRIDTAIGEDRVRLTALESTPSITLTSATYISANYYEASPVEITGALTTNMLIILKLDVTSAGTVTLNVTTSSSGTKTVAKINSAGAVVNIGAGELMVGKNYLFRYDGTQWIWVSANSADQIYISGTSGNIATVGSDNTLLGTSNWGSTKLPEGTMLNGRILPTVATNNLTLSLKTFAGTDPSSTDPVYVTIGGVVRTITSALSVTKNAGTSWFNSGAVELATKEIDYFAYLGYNSTDGVVLGFSRIPYARIYSDFNTTTTDERYCAISTITTAAAGDNYVVIGRFAATLSGTASFNWSVPTFTGINLVQYPIFETRVLNYVSQLTWTAGTAPTGGTGLVYSYKLKRDSCWIKGQGYTMTAGVTVTQLSATLPFSAILTPSTGGVYIVQSHIGVQGTPNLSLGNVNFSAGNLVIICTSVAATAFFWQGNFTL